MNTLYINFKTFEEYSRSSELERTKTDSLMDRQTGEQTEGQTHKPNAQMLFNFVKNQ